jgi:hypothetical protein
MAGKGRTRRAGRAGQRRVTIALSLVAAIVVAAVVGYFAYRAAADLPGTRFPDQGHRHLASPADPHPPYNSDPPTSGPHLPYLAPWGIHTRPITPQLQVHNLEDGGVLVQYNCDCPDLAERLATIVRRYDRFVILAPYPGMKSRIALTAWTRLETLEEFDEARIVRFIEAYRGIDHHGG